MCDINELVSAAKSKDGQVDKAYDDKAGHYADHVDASKVKEPAAKPHDGGAHNPMKLSGGA